MSDVVSNRPADLASSPVAKKFPLQNGDLRRQAEDYLERGLWLEARASLSKIWHQDRSAATAAYILPRYETLRSHLSFIPCRLAVLRSFTAEPLVPLLRAAAFACGIDLTVYLSPFNAYAQEILDKNSSFYRFEPDITILAVQTRDMAPELWESYAEQTEETFKAAMSRIVGGFRDWIDAFRSQSSGHLIIHNFELPSLPSQGMFDSQSETGQWAAIRRVNHELRRVASAHTGVYVLDYDGLIARYGRDSWHDERKWLTVRLPIAADNLVHLVNEWLRFIHPLVGRVCKALVTDLDNTLWGGVIGEDGIEGIQLGIEYPGAAYRSVQRVLLDLYHRGILLAICSKNNPGDVFEVLEKHPGMLLGLQHFASVRISWTDKAEILREIATELNIGIDSLAFLDDNPVERERIRMALPEVTVLDLPNDPMEFARALRDAPVFERLALSEEDRERGRYYGEQRQRVELERSACSLEDFYRSLRQEVGIGPVTPGTLTRVAQLTQKTNQFNLTTRRYTEQKISTMIQDPDWKVHTVRVKDCFGDNGLVGLVIIHDSGGVEEIDTFLLSCRVVGRTVETAILSFLVDQGRMKGQDKLQGWFLPTKKNDLAKDFYRSHNFQVIEENGAGTLWSLDLKQNGIACPEWIRLTFSDVTASDVTANA
jgi:FkbH-like protein